VNESTADLARSITWEGSKQTYFTGRLMIDRDLVDDFYRAYAYFRWADDVIDSSSHSDEERIAFIKRQRVLIDGLYNNEQPDDLTAEEEILVDLISHDRGENSGLQSFIRNMFAIIEFGMLMRDNLTLANGTRDGARTATTMGDDIGADYAILNTIENSTRAMPVDQIDRWTRQVCLACHSDMVDHNAPDECADCHQMPPMQ